MTVYNRRVLAGEAKNGPLYILDRERVAGTRLAYISVCLGYMCHVIEQYKDSSCMRNHVYVRDHLSIK